VETSGGLEAWLANRAARRIPHTDADAVLATLNIAYGEPDPVDAAMAVALRRAFRRTLDASVPPSLKPSPCSVALPSGDNPSRKKILAPGQEREMVGPKVVARIEEAHRSPSYSVRHPFTLPPVAVRTGPGVIVEFRPGCVGTPSKRPWTYSPHRFAGIICSIWKVLVVGSKQYSQASWARRRTTARTSRLSGLWTGRRRRAAMRRSSPGWSIKACALAEQPGLAQFNA